MATHASQRNNGRDQDDAVHALKLFLALYRKDAHAERLSESGSENLVKWPLASALACTVPSFAQIP